MFCVQQDSVFDLNSVMIKNHQLILIMTSLIDQCSEHSKYIRRHQQIDGDLEDGGGADGVRDRLFMWSINESV